jgi:hypothetical protein
MPLSIGANLINPAPVKGGAWDNELMLHKVEENTDWKSKYQDVLNDIELREREWLQIEELLRKTIGRLSIAGRGLDHRLDSQLRKIQEHSREKRDEKLAAALGKLSEVIASLEDYCKIFTSARPSATS